MSVLISMQAPKPIPVLGSALASQNNLSLDMPVILASVWMVAVGDVEIFNLASGPGSSAKKLKARLNGRVIVEAFDPNDFAEFIPTVIVGQFCHDFFQGNAMEWIFVVLLCHAEGFLK